MKFRQKTNREVARQRGLTRSSQSRYSYSSQRIQQTSRTERQHPISAEDNRQARRSQSRIRHIPTLIVTIGIICSLGYFATIDNDAQITTKTKYESTLREQSVYKKAVSDYINRSPINRSKLFFDSKGLSDELKKQFPEISAVAVSMPIVSRRPVVVIQASRPGFVLVSGRNSYIIGVNGLTLARASDVDNRLSQELKVVDDQSGSSVQLGKSAFPQEQSLFICTVIEQLEAQNIKVDSLSLPKSPYDLSVKVVGQSYFVKFNILEDAKQQVGSYIALKNKLQEEGKVAKEYIDVRVGERVYYK